jgi:Tol biopolymer transport system component
MKISRMFAVALLVLPHLAALTARAQHPAAPAQAPSEPHLANIKQLTFGGENAEAYFSFDGKKLIYQSHADPEGCDQIYTMNIDGSDKKLVSTGKGRCTCAYFLRDGRILFASTHEAAAECPFKPDFSLGYVWPVYDSYKIYVASADGKDLKCLTPWKSYNAEATVSPDGKRIVFTSDKDGDLELYTMDTDGKNLTRITHEEGYDGGAFFSPDSKRICYRGFHPTDPKDLAEYRDLLKRHLVRPTKMEIMVVNADGTGRAQVTHNGAANFCPFFHPDGKRILFASNLGDPKSHNFDCFLVNLDGSGIEPVISSPEFDAFPMFSPDGTHIAWGSNRNGKARGETNIFIADWVEGAEAGPSTVSIENLRLTIGTLASQEMGGRLMGTREGRMAAEYVAQEFKALRLAPPPGMVGPYQTFEFTSGVKLGAGNALRVSTEKDKAEYAVEKDFMPAGFSEDVSLSKAPVVFAGYGIVSPDPKWDDYSGLDVKGKAVIVYRYGPEGDSPKSKYAPYFPLRYKAMTAREKGAAVLLVVSETEEADELSPLKSSSIAGSAGIPVVTVKRAVLDPWLKAAGKKWPNTADVHAGGLSFEVPGAALDLTVALIRERAKGDNVFAWLPATSPTEETVVVGAHYDHLGRGIEGSLAEKMGDVHPGADDNASGVAGMLELARLESLQPVRKRNLLFVAFGGEELGALGSTYLVKNPPVPLKEMVAMVNLDMVGRMKEDKLVVNGSGTSPAWKEILEKSNTGGLKLTLSEDGYGASDQGVFYAKGMPVLFFFTGAHADYHKPDDTADKINYEGEARVIAYADRVLDGILALPERPGYIKLQSSKESAGGGFRVYLGTIPDYTEEVKGVKLQGVRAGGPAEKAGIQAGDVIVEFGGKKIENVYDYTYALQEHKPGETVDVVVLRGAERLTKQVLLARRPGE